MMDETQYRIEYTITRRQPGEDDFTEFGFGSSGGWPDLRSCAYEVTSEIENELWTEAVNQQVPGMPKSGGKA